MSNVLPETRDKLFDARNIVTGIQLTAENMDDDDTLKLVIQSMAKVAVEKIDAVTGGAVFDPPVTEKQMAKARKYLEKPKEAT
jgi:hypothetical protein